MNIKKNYFIIIQARFNSTRLKGKILKKINNQEILLIMLKRLHKYKKNIIINISEKNSHKLVTLCKVNKIKYFIGSDKNVLKRYYDCAVHYNAENIIRIPSDCPLIDPQIIERGIKIFSKNKYSYVTNLCPPTYIDGNDVEIITFKQLENIYLRAKSQFDKEHVTTYLRRDLKKYNFKNFRSHKNLSKKYRITLDYKEDFEVIKKIIVNLGSYPSYNDIVLFLEENKYISILNKKYIGKMWYQKNL